MKKALKEVKAKKPNLSHKEAFTEVSDRARLSLVSCLSRLSPSFVPHPSQD